MKTNLTNLLSLLLLFFQVSFLFAQEEYLVAHYTFEGDANDLSGNNNNGIISGPTLTSDREGVANSAFEFNGIDDKITVADDPTLALNEEYTLVTWVQPYSIKSQTIFRKSSSQYSAGVTAAYGLSLSGTGHFIISANTDDNFCGISTQVALIELEYTPNTWYQIIGRRLNGRLSLVIREFGASIFNTFEIDCTGTITHDSSPLVIGTRTSQVSNTFDGKIDEIKIYNKYLTLEEITGLDLDDDPNSTNELILNALNAYPNPASDMVTFQLPEKLSPSNTNINLYNVLGVLQSHQKATVGTNTIDMATLPQGTYIISAEDGKHRANVRVVKR